MKQRSLAEARKRFSYRVESTRAWMRSQVWWMAALTAAGLGVTTNFATSDGSTVHSWTYVGLMVCLSVVLGWLARSEEALPPLKRDWNDRFGFEFAYPKGWHRTDPDNGDGHRFEHPTEDGVSVTFCGSNGVLRLSEPTTGQADVVVLRKGFSGGFGRLPGSPHMLQKIEGDYVEKIERTRDGRIVRRFAKSLYPDREVKFFAQAPVDTYPRYARLFNELQESIIVLAPVRARSDW